MSLKGVLLQIWRGPWIENVIKNPLIRGLEREEFEEDEDEFESDGEEDEEEDEDEASPSAFDDDELGPLESDGLIEEDSDEEHQRRRARKQALQVSSCSSWAAAYTPYSSWSLLLQCLFIAGFILISHMCFHAARLQ